jgi:rhomboid protease GluP
MDTEDFEVTVKGTWLSKRPAEGSGLVAATSLLVIAGFSLLFWSDSWGWAQYYPANPDQVLKQCQYWRLFTSIFVHADLTHLLSNSIGVGFLGYLLYGYFGYKVYPCLMLGAGAVVTLIAVMTYPPHTNLLGASGVIYLMAAFWLALYVCLERRFSVGKRIVRVLGFLLIVLIPAGYDPQTSYRTHAIGFGVGIILAVLYFLANKNRLRRAEVVEIDRDG